MLLVLDLRTHCQIQDQEDLSLRVLLILRLFSYISVVDPFGVNGCVWREVGVQLPSLAHGCHCSRTSC